MRTMHLSGKAAKGAKAKIVGINNVGANGSVLKVVETKIPANKGYFVVGDVFIILSKDEDIYDDRYSYGDENKHRVTIVTDVGIANGNETITVKKADGTNWRSSDITTSSKIKHEWYPLSKKK